MSKIELVVKLPESIWVAIQNGEYCGILDDRTYNAIKNGTPLEKHDEEVIKETVESIWGKPPYTEMLDKMRAEIKSISPKTYPFLHSTDRYVKEDAVLQIIEKYKAESEVE